MDLPTDLCKGTSTRLWLGHRADSPFEEDQGLAARSSHYDGNSADGNWPTFAWTKAHRLHDIKKLCDACNEFDITAVADGGPPVKLRSSFFEMARTASRCRFCSLLAQSYRGVSGSEYQTGFLYMMGNHDAVDDGPVYLDLRNGSLNIRVPYPDGWGDSFDQSNGWLFGSFTASVGKDVLSTEETTDMSLQGQDGLSTALMVSTTDSLVSRLERELHRIIKTPSCQLCSAETLHSSNRGTELFHTEILPILPRRVIEILSPSVVAGSMELRLKTNEGTEQGNYVTLSHRWGGDFTLKTTKDTLSDRTRGFCLSDLPRTFQDVVLVAKALGIKYVWIDSLCILQDDQNEWLEESAKMGSIYMGSAFTIAAHTASQCNEGFLWRSQVPSALRIMSSTSQGGSDFSVFIPDLNPEQLCRQFFKSSIMQRAWVLQELTLSPRILHFVENNLFWECKHQAANLPGSTMETPATLFRKSENASGTHTAWLELVQRYSLSQMTKTDDKLVALAGIVNVLRRQLRDMGNPDKRHDDYHCGVFQADIERSLLWYNAAERPCKDIERHSERAPSWSWASVDCTLHFLSLELQDQEPNTLIRIKGLRHEEYTDPSKPKPHCHLVVEAPIIRVCCGMTEEKGKHLRNTPPRRPRFMVAAWKSWEDRTTYAWCILDDRESFPGPISHFAPGPSTPLSFLAVWGREDEGKLVGAWCIMVSPVNGSLGMYRRVGIGYVREVESVELALASPEVITLT